MADNGASHRLDLRVGGKYRLGKKIGSGSFGVLSFLTSKYNSLKFILFRWYLPRNQHHLRRGGCHQAWISQSQTSSTWIWIKSLQNSCWWCRCPFRQMVWYRMRLQCYGPWPPWSFSRRPFQFLQPQVQFEDCSSTCRSVGLFIPLPDF